MFSAFAHGQSADNQNFDKGFFARINDHLNDISQKGHSEIYLSGLSYHIRSSYPPDILKILNERNWGLGVARYLQTANRQEGLYILVFATSINQPQFNLGYVTEWYTPKFLGVSLGAGLTGCILMRPDALGGAPLPVILPIVGLNILNATIQLIYFPPANLSPVAQGNVFYSFVRIKF